MLQNPAKWDEAREALKTPPLAPADFKICFRTYSDADPEQHLAYDLYRIQAQDALKVLLYPLVLAFSLVYTGVNFHTANDFKTLPECKPRRQIIDYALADW